MDSCKNITLKNLSLKGKIWIISKTSSFVTGFGTSKNDEVTLMSILILEEPVQPQAVQLLSDD